VIKAELSLRVIILNKLGRADSFMWKALIAEWRNPLRKNKIHQVVISACP
jgi:hypothetical protein